MDSTSLDPPDRFLDRCQALTVAALGPRPAARTIARRRRDRLAAAWGRSFAREASDRDRWRRALGQADAYVVAHLLAAAALPAPLLAPMVDEALVAWCFGTSRSQLDHRAPDGHRTPEVLLGALAAQPGAARRLLDQWEPEALDLLVGWHPAAVGPFLLAAATGEDEVETGVLLGRVVSHVRGSASGRGGGRIDDGEGDLRGWLALALAPFELHLLAGSPGWRWPGLEPLTVLRWLADVDAGDVPSG